ncbi:hypothetical protein RSW84_27680, partial [Escherichia coli]|nr:hypothetical protein [Escherichia coli]
MIGGIGCDSASVEGDPGVGRGAVATVRAADASAKTVGAISCSPGFDGATVERHLPSSLPVAAANSGAQVASGDIECARIV